MSTERFPLLKPVRRRSSILGALEAFRRKDTGISMTNVVVFLYVAENEGLSVSELAAFAGLSVSTASRSARALASAGCKGALAPYLGLVELGAEGPARNSRTLRLTEPGRRLCEQLERQIEYSAPIRPDRDLFELASATSDSAPGSLAKREPPADHHTLPRPCNGLS